MESQKKQEKEINADSAFIILIILLLSQNGQVCHDAYGDQDG